MGAMKVSELVKRARTQAGLSQRQLAEIAGTSQSQIANYELGKVSPTLDTLERIVEACGYTLRMRLGSKELQDSDANLVDKHLAMNPEARVDFVKKMNRFYRAGLSARQLGSTTHLKAAE